MNGPRVALAVLAACWGCSNNASDSPDGDAPTKPRRVVGLSVLTMQNPFFKTIADAMRDEAAQHGWEVIVVSGDEDAALQFNQVQDFIVKEVDAIVLCPCEAKAVGAAIQEANKAGIPVFRSSSCSSCDASASRRAILLAEKPQCPS